MNDDQKKMLTEELLGECWHDPVWHDPRGRICTKCDEGLNGIFDLHRTFLTWDDLGVVKDKLLEKGLWGEFDIYVYWKYILTPIKEIRSRPFTNWLFRPVDESGEPHFCRLVVKFLEGRK